MKIIFIQLPLVDHGYNYIGGNIPYAAASLSGTINKKYSPKIKAEYLPYNLASFGSNKIIIDYVLKADYTTICFSTYLWNAERNLQIAKLLKEFNPSLKIIFGGPEVCSNSFLLSENRDYIDIFISGEGEWFYKKYLEHEDISDYSKKINDNFFIEQPPSELVSESHICEPYTERMLNRMPDKSVFIELTRGCPYKCSYCFYSKNANRIRQKPSEILTNLIKEEKNNLNEIYILSPTFNKRPDFEEILDSLIKINHNINLHTEIKADGITQELAKKIKAAGFNSLEIGIQTLNPIALKNVNRLTNTNSEIEGLLNLKNAGINLKIGIIPGLPGDNPKQFTETIDKLIEIGFDEDIEFYPLMLLPGTSIREKVNQFNIKHQQEPPYFFIESDDFKFGDILYLKEYLENKTGLFVTVNRIPDFTSSTKSPLYKGIVLSEDKIRNLDYSEIKDRIHTSVFNIFLEIDNPDDYFNEIIKLSKHLYNEPGLFNIIIKSDSVLNDISYYQQITQFQENDFYKRLHLYDENNSGNKIAVYQLINQYNIFAHADEDYSQIEPILLLNKENYYSFKQALINNENIHSTLISNEIYKKASELLTKYYSEYFDKIAFENEDDYKDFVFQISGEFIDLPFGFSICRDNHH